MNKEIYINKILTIFLSKFKKIVKRYLFKSKLQRQTENKQELVKKLEEMKKEKIKRWSDDTGKKRK